jgi:hypothetical protein
LIYLGSLGQFISLFIIKKISVEPSGHQWQRDFNGTSHKQPFTSLMLRVVVNGCFAFHRDRPAPAHCDPCRYDLPWCGDPGTISYSDHS